MKTRILACILWAIALAAPAQSVTTTTVQGTIYTAAGAPISGTLQLSWPAFTTPDNQAIAAGRLTVTIGADGFLTVNLAPNMGATPAGLYYTAVYYLDDGTTSTEYWVVPDAPSTTIAAVRAQVMPAAQAVQAVDKAYVDQAIQQSASSEVSTFGGTLTGPLYLNGDPLVPMQAADKHYVDAQFAQSLPAAGGVASGPLTATQLGAVYQADQAPGTDFTSKLQACINGLDGTYGGTCDARNFTGSLAMSAPITIATANVTVQLPCATIATAYPIVVAPGTRNVTLHGCATRGTSSASGSQGGTVFLFSGSAALFQIGDSTYAADTLGFHLDNISINTTAASASTAQALAAWRTQEMHLESLYLLGNADQTALTLDGTGNYTGGTFTDVEIGGYLTAVNAIGHQIANSATTDWLNASTFLRLHIDCPTSGGNPLAGSIGINLQAGDGNTFTGGDVESCGTALHLGASAQNNTILGLRNENSTNQVVADAGSSYNNWITGGTMFTGKLTDNGTRNSFLDTFHRSFNALNGDWYGSQQDATLTNHFRLGIGTGTERGLLDRYQTDYGYRWTMGLSDASAGEQFYQLLDELNNVYRLSIGQYNHGQASTNNQTVINSAGTGAIVLNGSNNAGTGGVTFGSGGVTSSTVATIDKSGNANFTGTLQIGGTSQSTGTMTVRNNADAEVDYYLWPGLTANQKGSFTYKDFNGNSQWYMVKDQNNNWALNSAVGGLDSFKAYQSTNSGDTYINASNSSGAVRVNYESGSGSAFNIYGGNSSTLYAGFTGATSIKFPGLAASSGHSCLQIDSSGYISNTGASCSGGGGGTVNSGILGQIAYYSATGAVLAGLTAVPVTSGGTGATTPAAAIANLGALPVAGGTLTGPLAGVSASFSNSVSAATTIQLADGSRAVDLKALGAACDGSTNDSAALVNAITKANTLKVGVSLPAGTCVTDPINLPNFMGNGLIITGQGPSQTFLKSRTGLPVFDFSGSTGSWQQLSIRDLEISGSTGTNPCFYIEASATAPYQLEMHNVKITSCGGSGILDKAMDFNSTFDHIVVTNTGANAIDLIGDNSMSLDHVMVQNLDCSNCAAIRVHSGTVHIDNATGIFNTISATATAAATTTNQITLSSVNNYYGPAAITYGHGETLTGAGIPAGTTITSQVSGTPGGTGVYQLSAAVNVGAGTTVTNWFAGDWWGVFGDNAADDGATSYVRVMLDNSDIESFGQGGSAGTGGVYMKYGSDLYCNTTEFLADPTSINTVALQFGGTQLPSQGSTVQGCQFGGSGGYSYKNNAPVHSLETVNWIPYVILGDSQTTQFYSDGSGVLGNLPVFGANGVKNLAITNSAIGNSTINTSSFATGYTPITHSQSPYAQTPSTAGVVLGLDATGGLTEVDLQASANYPMGTELTAIKTDPSGNYADLSAYGTQTFSGVVSNCYLTAQWQFVTIKSDGSNWKVVAGGCTGGFGHGTIQGVTPALTSVSTALYSPLKTNQMGTIFNFEGVASSFTCTVNPTFTLEDCGTSAGTCSSPTALASVTLTAANTLTDGTISSAAINASHYLAWKLTAGSCSALQVSATVSY